MLKRTLFLVITLWAFLSINAQHFKYGVTANIHKGSIVGIHDVSKPKWGGGVGAFAQWPLVENDIYDSAWLYFSPQLEFSMQGERIFATRFSEVFALLCGHAALYQVFLPQRKYEKRFICVCRTKIGI